MATISKYIWFDGKFLTHDKAKVPVTTHAIHYGTSIFEGIRAYKNKENWDVVTKFASSEDKTMRIAGMKFPKEGYNSK